MNLNDKINIKRSSVKSERGVVSLILHEYICPLVVRDNCILIDHSFENGMRDGINWLQIITFYLSQ